MSESTEKSSVSRENVWVVRWVVFLFGEFSKPIVLLFWRKSRVEVNINVGIAMSKKENRRNEGGGCHIPSSETEGVVSAAAAHQIRVFVRDRAEKMQSRVRFRPLNRPTERHGPCAFRPNTDARCSLGLSSTRVLSARLDVYGSSTPSKPVARLGSLVDRLGSSAW